MPTVLVAYHLFPDVNIEKEVLSAIGAEVIWVDDLTNAQGRELVRTADALMIALEPVPTQLVDSMEACRIICRVGTGVDAIDIATATKRKIWVTNVPDYSVDEVSSHAIAFLLAYARRLVPLLKLTSEGQWRSQSVRPILRLKGQTLGLVGLGRIGRAVATKAIGLGLNVIAYDPYLPSDATPPPGVQLADWEALLQTSDFISLHVPLSDSTRQMMNADALAQMKPTAFLINTARGQLIDEDALLSTIRRRGIAGAALDVLSVEPPAPDHPLLQEEAVFITPHVGWYSEEANVDVRVRGAEDVVRVLNGGKPRTPVNQIYATDAV